MGVVIGDLGVCAIRFIEAMRTELRHVNQTVTSLFIWRVFLKSKLDCGRKTNELLRTCWSSRELSG